MQITETTKQLTNGDTMTAAELHKHLYATGKSAFEYALELSQRDEWNFDMTQTPINKDLLFWCGDHAVCGQFDGDFYSYDTDWPSQEEASAWKPILPPQVTNDQ